jgi:hypothetical protein
VEGGFIQQEYIYQFVPVASVRVIFNYREGLCIEKIRLDLPYILNEHVFQTANKKFDKFFYSTTPEFITYDSWVVIHVDTKSLTYCDQVTVTERAKCKNDSEEHSGNLL